LFVCAHFGIVPMKTSPPSIELINDETVIGTR
jgi:hypothetical protein